MTHAIDRLGTIVVVVAVIVAGLPGLADEALAGRIPRPIPWTHELLRRSGSLAGAEEPGLVGPPVVHWRFRTGDDVVEPPVMDGGMLYLESTDGFFYAIDPADGRQRWRAYGNPVGAATPTDGLIFLSDLPRLTALDAATGAERWTYRDENMSYPALAAADDVIVFGIGDYESNEGQMVAIDAASGAERWRVEIAGSLAGPVAVAAGVVYARTYFYEDDGTTPPPNLYALAADTGEVIWHLESSPPAFAEFAVAGDLPFARTDDGGLVALDPATGETLWRTEIGETSLSSLAVAAGTVFVPSPDGGLAALDAVTGQERWHGQTDLFFSTAPLVSDGSVFAAAGVTILALDAATGTERWRAEPPDWTMADLAIVDGVLYAGTNQGLVALDPASGTEHWRFALEEGGSAPPIQFEGVLFVGGADNYLYALGKPSDAAIAGPTPSATTQSAADVRGSVPTYLGNAARTGVMPGPNPRTHEVLWRFEPEGGAFRTAPVVAGGAVFAAADEAGLYALDATTGEERWRFLAGAAVSSPPAVADDIVVILADDGLVHGLDAATGTAQWQTSIGDVAFTVTAPAVVDGAVFVAARDALVALDVATGAERWRAGGVAGIGSPAVADGMVYLAAADGLVAVDAATGVERWRADRFMSLAVLEGPTPAVADGTVYLATGEIVYAFAAADGTERWHTEGERLASAATALAVAGGLVFANISAEDSFGSSRLQALDAATGQIRWELETGDLYSGKMAVVEDTLYARLDAGAGYRALVAFDAASGGVLWGSYEAVGDAPVVVGGVIYGAGEGAVVAIGNLPGTAGVDGVPFAPPQDAAPAGAAPRGLTRSGEQPGPAPAGQPVERWRLPVRILNFGFPPDVAATVADGVAFVGAGEGLTALNGATGAELWTVEGAFAPPAVADGIVYVGRWDQSSIAAFAAANGTERWSLPLGEQVSDAPLVVDGMVYVLTGQGIFGGDDPALHAIEAATGTELWRVATTGTLASRPVVAGDIVFLIESGDAGAFLTALDRPTGGEVWSVALPGDEAVSPTVLRGSVYVAVGDRDTRASTLLAVDALSGAERWRFATEYEFLPPEIAASGEAILLVHDVNLSALDPNTGSELWRVDLGAFPSAPAVAGDAVYVGLLPLGDPTASGELVALDVATGDERWRLSVDPTALAAPVVADSMIYVATSALASSDQQFLYALAEPAGDGQQAPAATPASPSGSARSPR